MQANAFPIDRELIKSMEFKLSDLAALWRGRQNTPDAEMIVRQYQAILRCMIELGYHEELVVDSELPDRLMPQEYLDLFK
ncbi:MAG: hypothetical protein SF123_01485 [Chloroflexota bacterium]|nr:hypothetical protein [Chloroflexota bacterium]